MLALLLTAALATPKTDAETVRKAIDDICGDTWCEGDYAYRFHRVALNPKNNSTQIYFEMKTQPGNFVNVVSLENAGFQSRIQTQTYQVSCNIPGYSTLGSIMQDSDSLNWDFYTVVSDCINSLEKQLVKMNKIN